MEAGGDRAAGLTSTLQNAAAALAVGTALDMRGFSDLALVVSGTFVGTVSFEGSIDDGVTWVAVGLVTAAAGTYATTATAAGIFALPAARLPLTNLRANVTAYTSGAITVRARRANAGSG